MTIHTGHPFADANPDPARRFRGRLGSAVTLWTAGDEPDHAGHTGHPGHTGGSGGTDPAGLTVTSLMVALGAEPVVLALLDPDSDFLEAFRETGRAVVQVLSWEDRQLAEVFAGTAPAPGGPFRQAAFEQTTHGPRLADATTWCGVRLAGEREVGWSVEVSAAIEHVEIGEDGREPLLHRRGRFHRG